MYLQLRFWSLFFLSRTSSISRCISCPARLPVIILLSYPSRGPHIPSFSWPFGLQARFWSYHATEQKIMKGFPIWHSHRSSQGQGLKPWKMEGCSTGWAELSRLVLPLQTILKRLWLVQHLKSKPDHLNIEIVDSSVCYNASTLLMCGNMWLDTNILKMHTKGCANI